MSGNDGTWDAIPSLNLEMDIDYDERLKSRSKRRHERTNVADLKNVLPGNLSRVPIRIGTLAKGVFDGLILDLSESGVRIRIPKALDEGELVKVGFLLNNRTLIAKAIIRWVKVTERFCDAGLEFQDLPKTDSELIAHLTSACLLSRVGKIK